MEHVIAPTSMPLSRGPTGTGAGCAAGSRASPPKVDVEKVDATLLRVDGPSRALRVWLGNSGDRVALEADVREVAGRRIARLSDLAIALGDVGRRHELEVRVIPRIDIDGPCVLVLFGRRTNRTNK